MPYNYNRKIGNEHIGAKSETSSLSSLLNYSTCRMAYNTSLTTRSPHADAMENLRMIKYDATIFYYYFKRYQAIRVHAKPSFIKSLTIPDNL